MFFSKYSASGNDFILTHTFGFQKRVWDKLAQKICNRHLGVGADGLIVLKPHLECDFEEGDFTVNNRGGGFGHSGGNVI